ncbi:MAG: hypothetical protein ABGU93_07620 [Acetobacterium sp.]|uniref:hypothetical protein n=1 Tax=Acetobacterium sp. TaxID=1872094 RepID=UPI003241E8F6
MISGWGIFFWASFYEDEPIDYDFFRDQARRYGSDEAAYMQALEQVRAFLSEQRGAMFDPVLIDILFAIWDRILEIKDDLSDHD